MTVAILRVSCSACGAIMRRGDPDDMGRDSSGICAPCMVKLYGDTGRQVLLSAGPHDDPDRARLIREYLDGLESDTTLDIWTREDEPILWIRVDGPDGIELIRAEVIARDEGENWYVLTARLEQRSFRCSEVLGCSMWEA